MAIRHFQFSDKDDDWDDSRPWAAAGAIIIAKDTKRILLGYRSNTGDAPRCWGTFGGAIEKGETPERALKRELVEEIGFHGPFVELYKINTFTKPDKSFSYHTYIAIVPSEFNPMLNWETAASRWFENDDWPIPLHPGLRTLLERPDIQSDLSKALRKRSYKD
jgi:mutator protein MutT